jgi:hypothetical protein
LSEYVKGLSGSHPTLYRLSQICRPYGLDVFRPGERGGELVSRYGFDKWSPDPEMLLEELAEALESESRESAGEMFPEGRTIFYEGDDPAKFVAEIGQECPDCKVSVSVDCPAAHLDEIYGSGRWPMGS